MTQPTPPPVPPHPVGPRASQVPPTVQIQPVAPPSAAGARPVVTPAHRLTGVRSWWESVSQWRNWRLPIKVAAVLAVPAIAAVALGAVQIHRDVSQSNAYGETQRLIELRTSLMPLTTDLQVERWLAAQKLGTKTKIDLGTFDQQAARVDREAAASMALGDKLLDPNTAAGIRYEGLVGQLAGLKTLHEESINGVDVITVISNYGQMISAVLDLDEALTAQLGDPGLVGTSTALYDLEVAHEQVREQEAIGVVAIARGQLVDTELTTVRSSDVLLDNRLNDYQVVATPDQLSRYQQPSITNDINNREQLAQALLSNGQTLLLVGATGQNGASLGVSATAWIGASDAAVTQLASVENELADELHTTAANLQDEASDAAGLGAVVLFAILLLAIGVGVVIGRHLLRSLSILRKTALEVAEHQLPDVVADIERGKLEGLAIEPVPVHTHEELGQLARAFDAVHGQAVRSAVGQATLRSNLRNIFVNLSRRSQSLVERQLKLMERLERNEEDPQQLANLFKLDHLATRMRRNNENLMVLSGDDPARRSSHPLPLADVLRAAVSEIEHYQRVLVRSTPSVDVLGYASGDLVRLIAELLDNAASFSPPQTQVRIGGRSFPDGSIQIEIRDQGIGMAGAELHEANGKLKAEETEDVPVSRQMGLYVVGRLARRHSIRVSLEPVAEGGLRAVVNVPSDLVKTSARPVDPNLAGQTGASLVAGQQGGRQTNGQAVNGQPVNGQAVNGQTVNGQATNGTATDQTVHGQPAIGRATMDFLATFGRSPGATRSDSHPEWTGFSGSTIRGGDLPIGDGNTDFTWFVTDDPNAAQPANGTVSNGLAGLAVNGSAVNGKPVDDAVVTDTGETTKHALNGNGSSSPTNTVSPTGIASPANGVSPSNGASPSNGVSKGNGASGNTGGLQITDETYTAVGLPRRVPHSHGVPSLAEQPPSTGRQPSHTARVSGKGGDHAAATPPLNPARARGFLNDYQAGIRQGAHSRQESTADNGTGEDGDV